MSDLENDRFDDPPNEERLLSPEKQADDAISINSIRPLELDDFIGQSEVRANLKVFVTAAKKRGDAMDHTLLYGPPGLGKTTLAQIISRELGVNFRATSGPVIAKAGDLAALLTNLGENDVLFIDEIHRLNPAVEEILYPAMEDFQLDLIIGEGPAARSVRIDLPPFTLVGATTRAGLITTPLRERFGIPLHMNFYNQDELSEIILRAARILNLDILKEGADEIAKRSRGTPRVAGRLLRRVRDFASISDSQIVDAKQADNALLRMDVDARGLDKMDRRYLECMAKNYAGGPVGVDTMAAALANERDVLEEVLEPFLIQQGLVQRTSRGRMLTANGWKYIGMNQPTDQQPHFNLTDSNHNNGGNDYD